MLRPYYLRRKLPHMKKYLIVVLCMLLATYANAQQFFIKGGLGYDFPQAGQSFSGYGPYNGSITTNNNNSTTYDYKNNSSFAAGLQGNIGLGYMFTEHVGLEMDLIAGLASKKYNNAQYVDTGSGSSYTSSINANTPILLAPQLVLETGGTKFNFYARGGLVLPLYAHFKEVDNQVSTQAGSGTFYDTYTSDVKTGFSLGFTGAMGIQYYLNENVCFWGEVNLLSMSLPVIESDLTDFTENGVSYYSQISSSQPTVTKYSKSFSSINGTNQNVNNNNQLILPSYSIPFSSVGIHAGIMYRFPKSSRSSGRSHTSARQTRGGRPQ